MTQPIWEARLICWYNIAADERFAVQFVKQIVEKHSYTKVQLIIDELVAYQDPTIIPEYLRELQLKKQFYPTKSLKDLILREWITDKVSYVTQALINDFEDTWEHRDEPYDVFEDPDISMIDKYEVLDNWETYQGSDSNEKFVHPEYMRFGGNYQHVNFRERQSEENRSKNKKAKAAPVNNIVKVQQTFCFA